MMESERDGTWWGSDDYSTTRLVATTSRTDATALLAGYTAHETTPINP
jgi:hypothetical protein